MEMGRLGGGGIEQKGKRTNGHGSQRGDFRGAGCRNGLNGNKNKIKRNIQSFKKIIFSYF